jgi:hypothetical protein
MLATNDNMSVDIVAVDVYPPHPTYDNQHNQLNCETWYSMLSVIVLNVVALFFECLKLLRPSLC